jgi:hypothetical protein
MDLHRSSTLLWRVLTAGCLDVIAVVHIAIAPDHLREAPYAGVLFIALATAALVNAALLLTTQDERAWALTAALSVSALAAYLISRSVGLPLLGDDVGDWLNPLGVLAVLSEATALLVAGLALRAARAYRTDTDTVRLYTVVPAGPIDPAG